MKAFLQGGIRSHTRPLVSLFLTVLLVAQFAVPVGEAWGEILVLEADGERIPCRVLFQDEEKIIIRTATGTERTLPMSDVAEVLQEPSNVEVYEGVSEVMPRASGMLPYYLGVWCLRNGMPRKGQRLLELAAKNRSWAGRAGLALAGTDKTAHARHTRLFEAVIADPTLGEAVKALAKAERAPTEIPRETLLSLARAVQKACLANTSTAYRRLQAIKAGATPRVLDALSSRMTRGTGLSFKEFMDRCGEGLSETERAAGGARARGERTDCKNCAGSGFVICELCNGRGRIKCRQCDGRGILTSTKWRSSRSGKVTVRKGCTYCGGKGFRECGTCLRLPKHLQGHERVLQIYKMCSKCRGEGSLPKKKRTTVGGKTFIDSNDETCTRCNGRGTIVSSLDVKRRASGWRRCPICNKGGKIPFKGPPGTYRPSRLTKRPKTFYQRPTTGGVRFTKAEVERLKRFASLLSRVTSGNGDNLWHAGDKVPVQLSRHAASLSAGDEDELIFIDGKWVTPSTARLRRQRAKMLQYSPRKPDLAPFIKWVEGEELTFLRRHSVDIGAGADPAAPVMGLVSSCERAQAAGWEDAFDRACVFRTVFLPDSGATGMEKAACCWNVRRSMGKELVSFILLRDPARWPSIEVVAAAVSKGGLDMSRLGQEITAYTGSPLTLYYRVASCRRSPGGKGDDAVSRLSLNVRVVAAVVGHEKRPKKVWLHGMEGLAQHVADR